MSISFSCPSCDHSMKVRDELAGRKIKCPNCTKVVAVPADEAEEEFDEPEEEGQRPKQKKKKKRQKSNPALIVGIVGGILLLVGGVVGLALILRGSPDDSQAKAKPNPPPVVQNQPPKFEPKPKKGKGLITAIARRMEATEVNSLFRQLGIAYQTASLDNASGQGPLKFEQLGPNFASTPLKEWHDKEWIKVAWGVRLLNVQSKSSTALAWETDADSAGHRVVLMCDGTVQLIDEGTFAQTAKAMGK